MTIDDRGRVAGGQLRDAVQGLSLPAPRGARPSWTRHRAIVAVAAATVLVVVVGLGLVVTGDDDVETAGVPVVGGIDGEVLAAAIQQDGTIAVLTETDGRSVVLRVEVGQGAPVVDSPSVPLPRWKQGYIEYVAGEGDDLTVVLVDLRSGLAVRSDYWTEVAGGTRVGSVPLAATANESAVALREEQLMTRRVGDSGGIAPIEFDRVLFPGHNGIAFLEAGRVDAFNGAADPSISRLLGRTDVASGAVSVGGDLAWVDDDGVMTVVRSDEPERTVSLGAGRWTIAWAVDGSHLFAGSDSGRVLWCEVGATACGETALTGTLVRGSALPPQVPTLKTAASPGGASGDSPIAAAKQFLKSNVDGRDFVMQLSTDSPPLMPGWTSVEVSSPLELRLALIYEGPARGWTVVSVQPSVASVGYGWGAGQPFSFSATVGEPAGDAVPPSALDLAIVDLEDAEGRVSTYDSRLSPELFDFLGPANLSFELADVERPAGFWVRAYVGDEIVFAMGVSGFVDGLSDRALSMIG